jgi:hypothetical protein
VPEWIGILVARRRVGITEIPGDCWQFLAIPGNCCRFPHVLALIGVAWISACSAGRPDTTLLIELFFPFEEWRVLDGAASRNGSRA